METDLRLYRPRISTWWWTRKRTYFVFVMRELSSIFVAWFVVYLLFFVYAVGRGEAAYQRFLDWASAPWVIALNLVALGFVLLHTVTWFKLTPQAMAVRVMDRTVPAFHIIAGQYTGLVVVSAFVFWLVTR
jgi:fumarate reductase subunit C